MTMKQYIITAITIALCSLLCFFSSCKKDEVPQTVFVNTNVSDNYLSFVADTSTKLRKIKVSTNTEITGIRSNIVKTGICWNRAGDPTIADSVRMVDTAKLSAIKKQSGSAITSILFNIDVAINSDAYYVRGYVETTDGQIVYSRSRKIFNAVVDVQGNVYKTLQIGSQVWMIQDLRSTKYRNGDAIDASSSDMKNNNAHSNGFGAYLYNWKTVSDARNIAPEGWHIASDEEWKTLEKQIGMSGSEADMIGWRGTTEGNKLRDTVGGIINTSWEKPTAVYVTFPSNESGFEAHATRSYMFDNSGYGDGQGIGSSIKKVAFWWTSSSFSDQEAWFRYVDYNQAKVFRAHAHKGYGYAVRCVKD